MYDFPLSTFWARFYGTFVGGALLLIGIETAQRRRHREAEEAEEIAIVNEAVRKLRSGEMKTIPAEEVYKRHFGE